MGCVAAFDGRALCRIVTRRWLICSVYWHDVQTYSDCVARVSTKKALKS